MVVGESNTTVYDIVFVVETTANLGAYIEQLKTAYIQPALESFNGGPPEEIDYGCEQSCSLFGLVSYNGPDCFPEPTSRCAEPTTSIFQFLKNLMSLPYVGGCGDGTTFLSEGLATALHLFDDLKKIRETNVPTQKHCILLCNSAPCVLPSQESFLYSGFMAEDLINKIQQRDIQFSIISPRKIPGLYGLYDKNLTDHQLNTNKNYAVDSRHLVLLRGFQLEERPTSPGAKIEETTHDKKNQPGIPPNQVAPGQRYGSTAAPAAVSNSQASFKVPCTSAATNNKGQFTNAKQTAQKILDTVTNRVQTSGGGTEENITSMPNSIGSTQQQQTANVSLTTAMPTYPTPQTHGGMQPSMVGMRHPHPHPNMGGGAPGYPGNMPQGAGPPMHGGGTPGGPHPMPGGVGPPGGGGGAMVMPGGGGATGVGGGVGAGTDVINVMSEAAQMQQKKIIWKGLLEWQEKTKQQTPQGPVDTGNKVTRTLGCHVSLGTGEANINALQWPSKLQMQLIPQNLLQPLHSLFKNSRTVSFTFSNHEVDGLRSLYKVMASGFAGCVHIPSSAQSDVRVLMLLYSNRKKQFMGLIPNDQAQFINGIRTVITTQRQMHHKKAMQGPGVPGQPPFPGAQPNMPNPGQLHFPGIERTGRCRPVPRVGLGGMGGLGGGYPGPPPALRLASSLHHPLSHVTNPAMPLPPPPAFPYPPLNAADSTADKVGMGMPNVSMGDQGNPASMNSQPGGGGGGGGGGAGGMNMSSANQHMVSMTSSQPSSAGMAGGVDMMAGGGQQPPSQQMMKGQQPPHPPQQPQQSTQQQQPGVTAGGVISQEELERRANLQRIEALKKNLNALEAKEMQFQQQQQHQRQQHMMVPVSNTFQGGGPGPQQGIGSQGGPQGLTTQQQLQRLQQQQQQLQSSNPQLRHLLLNQQQLRQQQMQRGMAPPQAMMNQGQPQPNMGGQMQQRPPNFPPSEHFELMN